MVEILRPTFTAPTVEALPKREDILAGIQLVAFDVDGTLTEHHGQLEESVKTALNELGARGLNMCIISNAYGDRADSLRDMLGDPFDMPVFTPKSVALLGERPSKHRKPSPAMLLHAAKVHGVNLTGVLMVGDQIAKDVVSANRAGAKSLLLPRRGHGDDIKVRVFQRPPEALVRMALGIRFG
ncbi:HAD-IIIA family hydrolase [Candidatus Saccharibacteria bacterium]|nr:HAD-IIIA family hydrolase [Candidatus Saccharibacteria bacterium]